VSKSKSPVEREIAEWDFILIPQPQLGQLTYDMFIGSTLASNLRESIKHRHAKALFLAKQAKKKKIVKTDEAPESDLKPLPAPYRSNLPLVIETRPNALLAAWRPFKQAMEATPYDPVKVQAFGLAFCPLFLASKDFICKYFAINERDFDYSLHWRVMPMFQFRLGKAQ
jgi:hypothetical protein